MKRKRFPVYLDAELLERAHCVAEARGVPVNTIFVSALRRDVGRLERDAARSSIAAAAQLGRELRKETHHA